MDKKKASRKQKLIGGDPGEPVSEAADTGKNDPKAESINFGIHLNHVRHTDNGASVGFKILNAAISRSQVFKHLLQSRGEFTYEITDGESTPSMLDKPFTAVADVKKISVDVLDMSGSFSVKCSKEQAAKFMMYSNTDGEIKWRRSGASGDEPTKATVGPKDDPAQMSLDTAA